MQFRLFLYTCDSWSIILRDQHSLRVSQNMVPMNTWAKEGRRKRWLQHSEEFRHLYFSQNFIRVINSSRMKWTGNMAWMGERIGAYRVLVGIPLRRRPSGKPRCMWEDTIKIDLQTISWGVDCTDVVQYRHRWQAVVNWQWNFGLHKMQRILDKLRKC